MNAILEAIDLGDNMDRAIKAVRVLRGVPALTLGAVLLLWCVPGGWLAWYFDLEPTLQWSAAAGDQVAPTLASEYRWLAPAIGVLLTLLPMLTEISFSKLAASGIRMAGMIVFVVSLFDVVTDWPRVAETADAAWQRGLFEGLSVLAGPAFYLARLLLLFMATAGFEMLFVICLVCGVLLIKNGTREGG